MLRASGIGRTGPKGDKGADSTVPGPKGADSTVPGPKGADSTVPGPAGKSAYELAVAAGFPGTETQWLASLKATAGVTLVGTVTLGQTAAIAIALGIREVTATLAGAVKGQRYIAFCDSYRLNGGTSVVGRPAGYAIVDCVCNTDGQVTVSINAPLLAIGSSYALTCSIVRVNV